MYTVEKSIRIKGLAVTTAMASALLSGCASNPAPRADVSATAAVEAMAEGRQDRAIRHAEAAVLADPRSGSYRAMLGNTYLEAGRFAAAQTSFSDAIMLGENSPRTALSLALTLTAQAKYNEAAALLNDWEGQIATADLGLAMALAGQPERGIHLMSNAIRGGENTVKMRQNLAYAYAAAGRWREARTMASQDVPADQVGQRMARWAEMANPLAYQLRVANLLGVPAGVQDEGQPMQLALANFPDSDQLASEATAFADASDAAPAELADAQVMSIPASGAELPAVGQPNAVTAGASAPMATSNTEFAQAFATETTASETAAPAAQAGLRFESVPVVQSTSARYGEATEPRVSGRASVSPAQPAAERSAPRVAAQAAATPVSAEAAAPVSQSNTGPRAFRSAAANGDHLVQLGSFSSEQGARRAWDIYLNRYPELANHEMVITEAVVRGKRYYRVSAGGFNRSASRSMCANVDARGGDGCISWAAASPLPGAVETGIRLARR